MRLQVHGDDPAALASLSLAVESALSARGAARRPVVVACIGTDRSTGDALGPLVGQRLRALGLDASSVVGTLEEPLHAVNMAERLLPRVRRRPRPLVVAVDAALGPPAAVGTIALRDGGLRPGRGVGKELAEVGELALTGTVNVEGGALRSQVLQSTRLFLVQGLADTIGTSLWWALRGLRRPAAAETGLAGTA